MWLFCGVVEEAVTLPADITVLAFLGRRKPRCFPCFDWSSSLFESDGLGLIYAHKLPEETVGICLKNGNIFPCAKSVSGQVQGASEPSELMCSL